MSNEVVEGIILAGGKSTRMGSNKALIEYQGKSLIEHAISLISPYCEEIIISSNYQLTCNYPIVKDEIANLGPIGGIHSCLIQSKYNKSLITTCDMPLIDPGILQTLVENSSKYDLVYLELPDKQIQPLPLVAGKKLLSIVEHSIAHKNYALRFFIQQCLNSPNLKCKALQILQKPKNINFIEDLID